MFTAADGIELAVRSTGSGCPLLLVHGSNGGLDSWDDLAPKFADHQVWRYARRGYPPSGAAPPGNTFAAEADDLLLIARRAAADAEQRVNVVGSSYGASVALHAALRSTADIASLALLEPPLLLCGTRLAPVVAEYRELFDAGHYRAALELFLREAARLPDELLDAGPPVPNDPAAAAAALGDLEAMAADSCDVQRWSAIDVPVLLMGGADSWDPLPQGMRDLADVLQDVQRVSWEGKSHLTLASPPDLVAGRLRAFLGTV